MIQPVCVHQLTIPQYFMCAVLAEFLLLLLDFFPCVCREHKRLEKSVPEKKKELSQCEEELASLVAVESKLATQLKGLRAQAEEGRSSLEAFRSRCGHTQHTCTHTHTLYPPITPSPSTLICQPDLPLPPLPPPPPPPPPSPISLLPSQGQGSPTPIAAEGHRSLAWCARETGRPGDH